MMAADEPIETTNLDIYGHDAIPWSRPRDQLRGNTAWTHWLTTVRPDGRPHVAGVGAVWVDDVFYFTTGDGTRKGRNLAENEHCVISVVLDDIDVVVEGTAEKVTDRATIERLAEHYASSGWPAEATDGGFTAPYSAPSAGPPPWALWRLTPETAFGVGNAEPHGATRWRFKD
jgi:hypothetical protein